MWTIVAPGNHERLHQSAERIDSIGARMTDPDKIAQRLALLDGVELSPADLEFISAEIEDLERVVAELEEFAQDTPWVSQQTQPAGKKA
jgi:hypothetical protein